LIILNLFVGVIISEMDDTRKRHDQEANEDKMKIESDYILLLKLEHHRLELEKNMNAIMEELKRRHLTKL
jgi:hypothetical protein